jgi:hypothetical protein
MGEKKVTDLIFLILLRGFMFLRGCRGGSCASLPVKQGQQNGYIVCALYEMGVAFLLFYLRGTRAIQNF